jgi:protein phosphatase
LRGGDLKPVTEDHSLVAELVRSGDLTRAQASEHPQKNLITRALGAEEEVDVDTAVLPVEAGDRLLLCSDGLSDMVPETKMFNLLTSHPEDTEKTVHALVRAALDAGGADNITVVVVDVREEDPPAERARRGDTQELGIVTPEETGGAGRRERGNRSVRSKRAITSRGKDRGLGGFLGTLVRVLAVVLVLAALASPFYLWGQSRYFLGFDGGEVVIYRGLPYAPLGLDLNEEVRRTGLGESEVEERYRDAIENHRLYSSEEQAEEIVRGLEAEEPGQ